MVQIANRIWDGREATRHDTNPYLGTMRVLNVLLAVFCATACW